MFGFSVFVGFVVVSFCFVLFCLLLGVGLLVFFFLGGVVGCCFGMLKLLKEIILTFLAGLQKMGKVLMTGGVRQILRPEML